ncbi:hypothetical protein BOSE62_71373 [Bosea sp. 62]|nr:hypothetical protein BOSE21B_90249 [Bosea sp. 21B]CAD5295110.1 hypothetical protein BOSE46_80350 [Bosea sp. 46]CAD5298641.1 hypothetical protein BOSE7B_60417 [Bosea sp. 7B]VVT60895.1 hypothetical protein BOS5A_230172 [Bosea sp. EC-HK365B]VXB37267.1 hypothetical protein BOSE127_110415 [Bosea sp. 127]VXB56791.1 hypothetical protein BOSE125_131098 [Bosea sp. 125]VXC75846.1 hypothetical protein BOSE29B_80241 [Bosea sp. 29B]VXC90750.1 hypothetical protein BOSE62_71373 [Bosea sp. 62]
MQSRACELRNIPPGNGKIDLDPIIFLLADLVDQSQNAMSDAARDIKGGNLYELILTDS